MTEKFITNTGYTEYGINTANFIQDFQLLARTVKLQIDLPENFGESAECSV